MAPIQEAYQSSKEWQELTLKAYPPEEKVKVKKVKNKGTGHPGAKKEEGGETTLPLREAAALPDVNQPPPGNPKTEAS